MRLRYPPVEPSWSLDSSEFVTQAHGMSKLFTYATVHVRHRAVLHGKTSLGARTNSVYVTILSQKIQSVL